MRYYLLFPLLVLFALSDLNGQSESLYKQVAKKVYESVMYEDGSYFIGRTIEEDESHLKFELLSSKDTITIDKKSIIKWINSDDHFMYRGGRYHKKKGKFNILEFTFGGNENDGTFQFEYITGKLLSTRLGVGLGIGTSVSTANSVTWTGLSYGEIFVYGKYYLNDNRRRLFVDGKLGAAIPLESTNWLSYTAGPLLQPSIGFEFARSRKSRWSLKLSQFLQYSTIRTNENRNFGGGNDIFGREIRIVDKRLFNRTVLGIGLNF